MSFESRVIRSEIEKVPSMTPCSLVDTHLVEPTDSIFRVQEPSTLMMEQQVDIWEGFGGTCCLRLRFRSFICIMIPTKC